jgi:hypothetical protein
MKLAFVLLPFLALTAWAEDESLMTIHRIETETADRIQTRVLDPILGAGQSSVFVRLALGAKRQYELSDRAGEGRLMTVKTKTGIEVSTAGAFGFDSDPSWQVPNGDKQIQESRQTKGAKEERIALSMSYSGFHLTILHDTKVPAGKLAAVRSALLAVYKSEKLDLKFHPVEFSALK